MVIKTEKMTSDKFTYDLPKEWSWSSIFQFPQSDLGKLMTEVDVRPSEDMLNFNPDDEEMIKFE